MKRLHPPFEMVHALMSDSFHARRHGRRLNSVITQYSRHNGGVVCGGGVGDRECGARGEWDIGSDVPRRSVL